MQGNGKLVEEPIAKAVENLRISREGVFLIDLDSLLKGNPLVLKLRDGIYRVDFSSSPRL
jgi:predicted  nucleic acid-binding Zn-ribbon protein